MTKKLAGRYSWRRLFEEQSRPSKASSDTRSSSKKRSSSRKRVPSLERLESVASTRLRTKGFVVRLLLIAIADLRVSTLEAVQKWSLNRVYWI